MRREEIPRKMEINWTNNKPGCKINGKTPIIQQNKPTGERNRKAPISNKRTQPSLKTRTNSPIHDGRQKEAPPKPKIPYEEKENQKKNNKSQKAKIKKKKELRGWRGNF